ncbi:MobA/MobL family protein [Mesorhizobium sp. B2-3-10]|uniref:MobA/MobL family protein n=1 Tax=Mesorhizobium sp. B2-3-10 TaxID=2589954 RepID=UPI0011294797|nr:MobA/MobL family protein [Mesorhizobium sp. B2-3-10]TPL98335.1 hypothetical protein FJ943_15640 [Mesorhizobium sp. B2-3-10]
MAKQGYFRLEHSSVNRAEQGGGYLAASANYAANDNKCGKIIHINMAADRYAIRDYIERHEEALARKNARLGDKILLSLPAEMSEEHREEAAERFLWAITGEGRSRAAAFYHTDKPHNPHYHVILLDRDIETGESVALMGASRTKRMKAGLEANATQWLRKVWEKECNDVLAEHGYDIRIDRRTNLERGLEPAGEHRGFDNDNELEPQQPEEELEAEPDVDTLPGEDEEPSEEEMAQAALIDDGDEAEYTGTPHGYRVRKIFEVTTNLNYLRDSRTRLKEAEEKLERATKAREDAHLEASVHLVQTENAKQNAFQAEHDLKDHQTSRGRLKGFGVNILGFELKTQGRKEAEAASSRVERAKLAATILQRDQVAYEHTAAVAEAAEQAAEREAHLRRNELLDLFGNEQDMDRAEETFQNSIKRQLHKLNELNLGQGVTAEEMVEALMSDEITFDEFRAYLVASGQEQMLAAYDLSVEQRSKGKGAGIADD